MTNQTKKSAEVRKELMEGRPVPQLTEGLVDPEEVASFVKQFKKEFASDSLKFSREPRG